MFIELSPVNVDNPCKELINVNQIFSFVEDGDTTLITIRRPKGALVEVIVKETYAEIKEKLSGVLPVK